MYNNYILTRYTNFILAKEINSIGVIFIITVESLNDSSINLYEQFLIDRMSLQNEEVLAYGAKYENIPCGAIFARIKQNSDGKECEVTSFFVLPFFRKKGVGTELLNALKGKLRELDIKETKVNAVTSKKNIELLENFLTKRGFFKAKLLTEVYLFDPKVLINENKLIKSILNSDFELPEKVELLPKTEVREELLEKVRNKEGIDYPDVLSPFANEFNLDDECTQFAVFDDKEIVGWMTALRTPENAILYRSLFVREDYRKSALGYFIFNSIIKLHITTYIEKKALYAVAIDNIRTKKLFSLYLKNLYDSKKYEFEIKLDL